MRKKAEIPIIEPKIFRSREEIDRAIERLSRRIKDLEAFDAKTVVLNHTGADHVVLSDVRNTIREVFGSNSPEFHEHGQIKLWTMIFAGNTAQQIQNLEQGKQRILAILRGLIRRLEERRADMGTDQAVVPSRKLESLNLHTRIRDVAEDLFSDSHYWEAVFAGSNALINYVKERSGRDDLDGTNLVRTVFSKNNPRLAFNELATGTDLDEQEGMMHLFEGAVLAMRNPGGHDFPKGPEQRAIEYISFLSLLAYRLQEARVRKV